MDAILAFIDRTPLVVFVLLAAFLGFAPFYPEPHIWEKLKMLARGTLHRPVDIFDLLMHATPWLVVVLKAVREFGPR